MLAVVSPRRVKYRYLAENEKYFFLSQEGEGEPAPHDYVLPKSAADGLALQPGDLVVADVDFVRSPRGGTAGVFLKNPVRPVPPR